MEMLDFGVLELQGNLTFTLNRHISSLTDLLM